MTDEKKKMTAHGSSVGADDGQSISQNSKTTIPDPDEKNNSPERDLEELYQKMRRMSDPVYLHTVTLDELLDNVFEGKSAVIENLLYTGAYILAGAPKIGKSFLVAQIAHHVSSGQDLWGYKTHRGTVLYLALEDDESRLQRRMFRMFGVEGTNSLHFATNAKMIGGGLDEQLEKFVREYSDTKLIVVDTLQKVREAVSDSYSYSSDYEVIGKLKQFADRYGVCVLIVHHTRKQPAGDSFEMISGTTACWAVWMVRSSATVAERKRWGGILPPHLQGGCPILGHPKSIRGCRDSRHPMPRNRAPGTGAKSVRRTRSHRMKFCVQKGLGGVALNKQFVANG
ncbi:hypothetical protein HMPREF0866_00317 [Ruminococcaceae bacterium D16]|nr:hypothetical protein HMPREF0866_00317 [Ruminococcaceae bacterium D16]